MRRSAVLHVPDPRPVRDALIAATALVRGWTVVTRNVDDFEPNGVKLLHWARPSSNPTVSAEVLLQVTPVRAPEEEG